MSFSDVTTIYQNEDKAAMLHTNMIIPDIIIEIMPGASLWHRKCHVPGHCTSSIRRSQTHHFGFIEGKSY